MYRSGSTMTGSSPSALAVDLSLRVCVLSDEDHRDFDPGPFLDGFAWEMVAVRAPVAPLLEGLAGSGRFDVFLNLCEGYEPGAAEPDAYDAVDVIRSLERLGVAFTGAGKASFDPTRERMQEVAEGCGIAFARGRRVASLAEAERLASTLRYPLMVKHPQGYGSTGVWESSRVEHAGQLSPQVERVCAAFGAARVEEFVAGPEFTVLVVEDPCAPLRPVTYPPARVVFPKGEDFWHARLKWEDATRVTFARVGDESLAARLQDVARRMFVAMRGEGYARCDIRLDAAGDPVVLEINANPAVMYRPEERGPADFTILCDPEGYRGFFARVFRSALARQARHEPGIA